jgi:hypothetical protein
MQTRRAGPKTAGWKLPSWNDRECERFFKNKAVPKIEVLEQPQIGYFLCDPGLD